jgi:electron transport complex protein RnfE
MAKTITQEFTKGLWKEIPPFRLVLGLCPVLAVTKALKTGLGMGLATTFVLLGSNIFVSLLRNIIPSKVRIACFIVVIASFVTLVELLMQAFQYPLYEQLGIFIPLIVVNCIVLGRSEAFASKNKLMPSIADGLGMGLGFTLSLSVLGGVREILGYGTILRDTPYMIHVFGTDFEPFGFMVEAPGAFVGLGLMLCLMNLAGEK